MHKLFLSSKSMYTKCINFHDIIICFYLACIVNFNSFFISIVQINVHQSIDFQNKFLMLQILYWFLVSLYGLPDSEFSPMDMKLRTPFLFYLSKINHKTICLHFTNIIGNYYRNLFFTN